MSPSPVPFWRRLAVLLGTTSFGAVVAFCVLSGWGISAVGLGGVERIRQLGLHLETPLPDATVAFVGDSVTLEGIDGTAVEKHAPTGWAVQNLALTGCYPSEVMVLLPKLLKARPRAVAFCVTPVTIPDVGNIATDKSYAYALGGFVSAWPEGWNRSDVPGLSEESYDALRATRQQQLVYFRSAPLNALNYRLRASMRKDLRAHVEAEWSAPYEMLTSFGGERLEWHRQMILRSLATRKGSRLEDNLNLLERMTRMVRDAGATPIVVVGPVHPIMRGEAEPVLPIVKERLARLSTETGTVAIDCSDILTADDYADSMHPNESGRRLYSEAVGRGMPPLDGSPSSYETKPRDIAERERGRTY